MSSRDSRPPSSFSANCESRASASLPSFSARPDARQRVKAPTSAMQRPASTKAKPPSNQPPRCIRPSAATPSPAPTSSSSLESAPSTGPRPLARARFTPSRAHSPGRQVILSLVLAGLYAPKGPWLRSNCTTYSGPGYRGTWRPVPQVNRNSLEKALPECRPYEEFQPDHAASRARRVSPR